MNKDKKDNYNFDDIKKEELKVLTKRRKRILYETSHKTILKDKDRNQDKTFEKLVDHTIVGLSLSGGGIRSALLNLGVLQELSRIGFLKIVDILSTISGGGYIGGCLSSLLSIKKIDKPSFKDIFSFITPYDSTLFSTSWEKFPFRDRPPKTEDFNVDFKYSKKNEDKWAAPFPPKIQMKHLRNHSNYLVPGKNFYELLKDCGALLLNSIFPILWFLSVMTFIILLYMWLIFLVYHKTATNIHTYNASFSYALSHLFPLWIYIVMLFISFIHTIWYIIWKCKISSNLYYDDKHGLDKSDIFHILFFLVIILSLLFIYKYFYDISRYILLINSVLPFMFLLIPLFYSLCLLISSIIFIIFNKIFTFCIPIRYRCTTLDNLLSILYISFGITSIYLLFSIIFAFLPYCIKLDINFIYDTLIGLFIIFTYKLLLKLPVEGQVNLVKDNILLKLARIIIKNPKSKNIAINLLTVVFIILLAIIIGHLLDSILWHGNWLYTFHIESKYLYIILAISGILAFIIIPTIDLNKISDHFFYKKRLSEAFLQTSIRNLSDENTKIIRNSTNMKLTDLHGNIVSNSKDTSNDNSPDQVAAKGPYHIITATLNLTSCDDLRGLRRRSEPFTFSRLFVGSERTGYINTKHYPDMTLSTAMTISGAAISPVMGKMTNFGTSFFCTLLGSRLGYWLTNPKYLKGDDSVAKPIRFWLYHIFHEFIGRADADGKYIYLSDGGHCGDNLGIIPLLKRRAKLVIASDAEHDPHFTFESLNNSLREIYVDEAIKIDIERPYEFFTLDKNGFSKKHFLIGRILYPDRPWQASWIIVLKSSLTGDEIAPILNYKKKSKDFPNETTTNQFFTEEQFESYRALGRHIVSETFSSAIKHINQNNPWKQIDSFCREIERLEIGCKTKHRWDDIFTAMWDCENVDFSSWEGFKQKIDKFWEDVKELKKEFPDDILIEQLGMLHEWLNKQGHIDASIPIPKTLEEFHKIKDQLSKPTK